MRPPGTVELRDIKLPQPGTEEVLVRMEMTGISPGTELRCLAGKESGSPDGGFIPGYQGVGRIISGTGGSLREGDRVFLTGTAHADLPRKWGGHVSHAVCGISKVYKLDEAIPTVKAVFAKLGAISHHGIQVARIAPDERVAVVGLGPIGFFSAQILKARGFSVTAFDLAAERVEAAESQGIDARRINPADSLCGQITAAGVPDVLIDATGVPALLPGFIAAGRELPWTDHNLQGLRLIIQGSYPDAIQVDYKTAFMKEISIHFPRDHQPADVRAVLNLMADGAVGLPDGAVELVRPEDAADAYRRLGSARALPLSCAVMWEG
jgi:2-desacetyl-2-hydroxyethyl bacteriochlorophyllide A dehydrogenase